VTLIHAQIARSPIDRAVGPHEPFADFRYYASSIPRSSSSSPLAALVYHSPFSGSHMHEQEIPCERASEGDTVMVTATGVRYAPRLTAAGPARIR
jgi:hypothetical protein